MEKSAKPSLISRILSRHKIEGDLNRSISEEVDNFIKHQTENMKMLERRIEVMTSEIDSYKERIEVNQEKMIRQSKMSTIGEVTATLSHEINNQLMTLKANCEIIDLVNTKNTKNNFITKSLLAINTSLMEMTKLIKNVGKFSFHSQEEHIDCMYDSPHLLVNQAISVSNNMFKNSRVKIIRESWISEDIKTFIPSSELGQVLLNLLKNAFDHVASLDDNLRFVKIRESCDNNIIKISVINSGEMPESVKEKLFQPFFTTKQIGKGTGIGLSLSKKILDTMGGKIYLDDSGEKNEICFSIEFPISEKKLCNCC